tara:strand:- start:134 stop:466 length:333 start_codon:yes stop_codon:yes gene_type:complete
MDIKLITIITFILTAIVFLLIFVLKSINKKSFTAEDGSVFENQTDLDIYEKLYAKTKLLFTNDYESLPAQSMLGFQKSFLSKLTTNGFPDLKTLVKYRKQFQLLIDLLKN